MLETPNVPARTLTRPPQSLTMVQAGLPAILALPTSVLAMFEADGSLYAPANRFAEVQRGRRLAIAAIHSLGEWYSGSKNLEAGTGRRHADAHYIQQGGRCKNNARHLRTISQRRRRALVRPSPHYRR